MDPECLGCGFKKCTRGHSALRSAYKVGPQGGGGGAGSRAVLTKITFEQAERQDAALPICSSSCAAHCRRTICLEARPHTAHAPRCLPFAAAPLRHNQHPRIPTSPKILTAQHPNRRPPFKASPEPSVGLPPAPSRASARGRRLAPSFAPRPPADGELTGEALPGLATRTEKQRQRHRRREDRQITSRRSGMSRR